jgi:FkbM family methyltransferase
MLPILSGREMFGDDPLAFFKLLRHLPPGLMIDVGAAAGIYTNYMRQNSPNSRIVSYEPFPGNHSYFLKTIGNDPRVDFRVKAVGNKSGIVKFHVSEVVQGGKGSWSAYEGYSSVGFIIDKEDLRKAFEVECVRLDDEYDEPVRLLKIDVQGGEFNVLDGASRLSSVHGIDLMFVEIVHELELLGLILGRGYQVYDSLYTILVKENADLSRWDVVRELTLSTGRRAIQAWPKHTPVTLVEYYQMYMTESKKVGNYFTDLVCCAPGFLDKFTAAASSVKHAKDQ